MRHQRQLKHMEFLALCRCTMMQTNLLNSRGGREKVRSFEAGIIGVGFSQAALMNPTPVASSQTRLGPKE